MPPADKVSHASLNSIYVKAQELDRGHNGEPAPSRIPPGEAVDATSHSTTHVSDAQTHATTHASDAQTHASDGE